MTLTAEAPVTELPPVPENATDAPGAFGWYWAGTLAALADAGATVVRRPADAATIGPDPRSAPRFVVGEALFALPPCGARIRDVVWFLDDPSNLASFTERELARVADIYSPMLPDELPWPAGLPATAIGAALARMRFVTGWPELPPLAEPPFSLSHLTVDEPFPVTVWQADFRRPVLTPLEQVHLVRAMLDRRAPVGFWLLPPPLNALELRRLQRFAPPGTTLIPCVNLRAGAQAAIARRAQADRAGTLPGAMPPDRTVTLVPNAVLRCFSLSSSDIECRLKLAVSPPSPQRKGSAVSFAAALADWQAGRTSIVPLAHAFVDFAQWQNGGVVESLRRKLLVESPATPAAFLGNALGRLPLRELYANPTERTRALAEFGRALLDPAAAGIDDERAPANETLRLLAAALCGDETGFAGRATKLAASSLRSALTVASIGWVTGRTTAPAAPPPLPATAADIPGEVILAAAAACTAHDRWDEALQLAGLAHRSHPDLLTRGANVGRWSRHLLWAALCARWGDHAESAAALAWLRDTDFTADDQLFLADRAGGARPTGLPDLPRFAAPWRVSDRPS